MKTTKFFIFFFLLSLCALSQQNINDSLIGLTNNSKIHDTVKIKLFGDISWNFLANDIEQSMIFARKELALAQKINNRKEEAQGLSDIGNIFNRRTDYDSALFYYNKALKIRESLGDKIKSAGILTNIATVYMRQSKFEKALDINFKTLKIFEQINDTSKQTTVLCNVGNLYYELKKDNTANNFYIKALKLAKLAKLQMAEGNALVLLGGIQFGKGIVNNVLVNKINLDSAFYYFSEAEKILSQTNALYNLSVVNNNLGRIYVEYKQYDKAIEYYNTALEYRLKLNDVYGAGLCYLNLGRVYRLKLNYGLSEEFFNKSITVFLEAKNFINLKQSYGELSELYEAKKDYLKAMKFHQLYAQYQDSVYTGENAKQMAEMETKYETEKKDLEIAKHQAELNLKEEELKQKKIVIFSIIGLTLLIIISGILVYRKKQVEQKAKLDAEISLQKEIRIKAIIEAEEKERRRIAQDLHDGVGQILSAAKLNLSGLESQLDLSSSMQKDSFKNVLDLIDDSVKEVRAVSHNMMPNTLIKLGLGSAIREFITKIGNVPNLKIDLEIVGLDKRIEESTETVLYRVIQEVVSNIIKHAKATEISLQLIKHENELSVLIEDNGVGFDTSKINDFEGIGLKNIISRVEFINGTVHFDSTIGKGTTVIIEVKA